MGPPREAWSREMVAEAVSARAAPLLTKVGRWSTESAEKMLCGGVRKLAGWLVQRTGLSQFSRGLGRWCMYIFRGVYARIITPLLSKVFSFFSAVYRLFFFTVISFFLCGLPPFFLHDFLYVYCSTSAFLLRSFLYFFCSALPCDGLHTFPTLFG